MKVKDAIAYFRLATNPDDDEALRRVINYPARGIGDTTLKKLIHAAIERGISVWGVLNDPADLSVNSGTLKKLEAFRQMIAGFNELDSKGTDAAELSRAIYTRTGLLTSLISDNTPESVSQQENLMEMQRNVEEFVAGRMEEGNEAVRMCDFLSEVSLATDQDEKDTSEERVTLMTVHAAKGLEFKNVMVVGVEEELFPSAMACDSLQSIEEERRLLYVAITRAKAFCMLSYASSRFRNGQTMVTRPSRFLKDIDPQYLKMVQGTEIDYDRGIDPLENYRSSFHSAGAGNLFNPPPAATAQRRKSQGENASAGWLELSRQKARQRETARAAQPAPQKGLSVGEYTTHSASELYPGMKIRHLRFGRGTIEEVDDSPSGARITVTFSGSGIGPERKTLLLKFAPFRIEE